MSDEDSEQDALEEMEQETETLLEAKKVVERMRTVGEQTPAAMVGASEEEHRHEMKRLKSVEQTLGRLAKAQALTLAREGYFEDEEEAEKAFW